MQGLSCSAAYCCCRRARSRGRFHIGKWTDVQIAGQAVDDDRIARIGDAGCVLDVADSRNAKRPRHDSDMRVRSALFKHQAAQALAVIIKKRRRTHRAGNENGVFRQALARGSMIAAGELAHQTIGEVVKVVQSLAQKRIGLPQHPGPGIGLHALHGGLGGKPGHHRFFELVHPAAVIGEHPIRFQDIAMFAALDHVAVLEHFVEASAQGFHCRAQMRQFLLYVVGDEIGHHNARLVQYDVPQRNSFAQGRAFDMNGTSRGRLGARQRQRRELARGDHLGQHHRRGLQRLDFFFRIGPPRPVLHHQHAQRIAGAQHRHAEERVIDFLAGFRPVRKRRMRLRIRQVDRARLAGHQADQPFVGPHHGAVHGVAIEAFGGIQFEGGIDAQHIDGADLRNHVGGDQHHDLVKAFLRADRLRHDFAKPTQQHARTTKRATHGVRSLGPGYDRSVSP